MFHVVGKARNGGDTGETEANGALDGNTERDNKIGSCSLSIGEKQTSRVTMRGTGSWLKQCSIISTRGLEGHNQKPASRDEWPY